MVKVEYEFDPFELVGLSKRDLSSGARDEALDLISDYVLESVLSFVGDENSPVSGRGAFKALSKEYKAKKEADGGTPLPNLLMNGDLLDSVKVVRKGDKLKLTVDQDQQDKADGHNNFSGDSKIPTRRFIPKEEDGETFKQSILNGIKTILEEAIDAES